MKYLDYYLSFGFAVVLLFLLWVVFQQDEPEMPPEITMSHTTIPQIADIGTTWQFVHCTSSTTVCGFPAKDGGTR
ncbi:MAG: hypothetical protein H8D23_37285 [Candidatus Brocadiales bacterium]|nr:hypothetical protein [Candidatus Brocadiales bacterium]